MPSSLVVSCLIDAQPRFRLQGVNWIGSLLASGTAAPQALCVHLVNDHPGWYRDLLARLGVTVIEAAPLGTAASPYCNKLAQLKSRPVRDAAHAALLDADVVVTRNLSATFRGAGVRAKTTDTAIPPLALLGRLLRRAGFREPPEAAPTDFGHGDTARGNCNGGVYLCDKAGLDRLAPYWIKWAGWVLGQQGLLGPAVKHADQIGFLLALLETATPVTLLPLSLNFPTHLKKTTYAPVHDIAPDILHYHDRLDDDGLLLPLGLPRIDAAITRVNAALRAFHESLPTRELLRQFRDARSLSEQQL